MDIWNSHEEATWDAIAHGQSARDLSPHHCSWYTFLGMHTPEVMVALRVLGPYQPHTRPGMSFIFLALTCSSPGCCSLLVNQCEDISVCVSLMMPFT